mmetsp:Transcript_44031/g.121843  ORF Transcript_44031/g.121843 Transcript_44031/m.121843 type:complete len:264 (-) Transcript_44031:173-964(-)
MWLGRGVHSSHGIWPGGAVAFKDPGSAVEAAHLCAGHLPRRLPHLPRQLLRRRSEARGRRGRDPKPHRRRPRWRRRGGPPWRWCTVGIHLRLGRCSCRLRAPRGWRRRHRRVRCGRLVATLRWALHRSLLRRGTKNGGAARKRRALCESNNLGCASRCRVPRKLPPNVGRAVRLSSTAGHCGRDSGACSARGADLALVLAEQMQRSRDAFLKGLLLLAPNLTLAFQVLKPGGLRVQLRAEGFLVLPLLRQHPDELTDAGLVFR